MKALRFYIYVFCTTGANSIIVMFLSLYLKALKVNDINIGGMLGLFNLMMPLVILFLGFLADRFSCRKLILLGSFISCIYCFFMPFIHNINVMIILIILGGIGITFSLISVNILFLKKLNEDRHGIKLSIFVASNTAGYAVGSAVMSMFIKQFNFPIQSIFYFAFPLHVVSFFAAVKFPEVDIEKFPVIKYFHDIKQIPVFCLAVVSLTVGMHWGAESYVVVRFMNDAISASGLQMALFFLLTGLSMVSLSRISGHIVQCQNSLIKIIIPGILVSSIFHIGTYWANTFNQFLLLRILHTCGDGIVNFCIPMWVSIVFMKSRMGGNFGFNRTLHSAGTVAGNMITGYLVAKYSLRMPFMITGIIQILSVIIIWWLMIYRNSSKSINITEMKKN